MKDLTVISSTRCYHVAAIRKYLFVGNTIRNNSQVHLHINLHHFFLFKGIPMFSMKNIPIMQKLVSFSISQSHSKIFTFYLFSKSFLSSCLMWVPIKHTQWFSEIVKFSLLFHFFLLQTTSENTDRHYGHSQMKETRKVGIKEY